MNRLVKQDLLHPELSYEIVGVLFEADNKLGSGYQERYYQKLIADLLTSKGLKFKEQVPVKLVVDGQEITKGVADFVIEGKIVLEIKQGERFLKKNIEQLYSYLKLGGFELGILANFTSHGVQFKRIVNTIRN